MPGQLSRALTSLETTSSSDPISLSVVQAISAAGRPGFCGPLILMCRYSSVASLEFAKEFGRIHDIVTGALADEQDTGGPAAAADTGS